MTSLFINREKNLRSGWKILFVLVASIFLDLVVNSILSLKVKSGPLFENADFLEVFRSPGLFFIIVTLFVVVKLEKKRLVNIGLSVPSNTIIQMIVGFLCGGGMIVSVLFVLWLTGNFTLTDSLLSPHFSNFDWVTVFTISIFPGIGEEILFRGYVLKLFDKSVGRGWSIILTSVLFSLLHGGNDGFSVVSFISIFLLSVVFCYVTIKTKTLWTAMLFHISWNFFQAPVFGVRVSGSEVSSLYDTNLKGSDLITGGSFGIEGSVVTMVMLLLLALVIVTVSRFGKGTAI